MLKELGGWDWCEAFGFVGETASCNNEINISTSEPNCPVNGFNRESVFEIYGVQEGENDGAPWMVFGKLKDGRYFYLEAGCDYTGWDCRAGGGASVSLTKEGAIKNCLTEEARRIFGIVEDNVGEIELKYDPPTVIDVPKTKTKKEIKSWLKALGKKRKDEVDRHKKEMDLINEELGRLQDQCKHIFIDRGDILNSDNKCDTVTSVSMCNICGKIEL